MKKILLGALLCAAFLPCLNATTKDEWEKDAQTELYSKIAAVLKSKSNMHKIKDPRYDSDIKASYRRILALQEQILNAEPDAPKDRRHLEEALALETKKLDAILREKSYYNLNTFFAL